MILVIPSIELKDGQCTTAIQGTENKQEYYNQLIENPLELCHLMRRENSKSLHILDMDSFESHSNLINLNSVLYIAQVIDIPIQFHTSYSSIEEIKMLLDNGIYRVIIDDLIYENQEEIKEIISSYGKSRIAFFAKLDDKNNVLTTKNEVHQLEDYLNLLENVNADRVVFNRVKFHNNESYDIKELNKFLEKCEFKVTLYDGVNTSSDLLNLTKLNSKKLDSVILSKALNMNAFPCQDIWRKAEELLEK